MKKLFPFFVLLIGALLFWDALYGDALFDPLQMVFEIEDTHLDGPLSAVFGTLLAGGGLIIGLIALVVAAVITAVLCAGAGVILLVAVVLAAIIAALASSPLLLPLLIPVAIIWALSNRDKQRRHGLTASTGE